MDEAHFVTALRYVALNPVRARLVARNYGGITVTLYLTPKLSHATPHETTAIA